MADVLALQVRLAAPPADVYRALTDAGRLSTWLAEHADVSLTEERFEFWGRFTPQGARGRQRLVAAERDRALTFRWTLDDTETTVAVELTPDAEGTTLAVRQDNMPTLDELMAPEGRRDGRHSMHTFWGLALANLAEYLDDRPLTPKADFGADRPPEIRAEIDLAAPPWQVFASLVEPERIARWFGWEAEVEPRLGGRMTLGVDGRIFEFEPGRLLAYSDGEGAVVRWELAGSGGATRLTFVQSGFAADELDDAAQHEAGWLGALAELRRMHELDDAWRPLIVELPTDGDPP